jgi:hypothetical protein
MGLGTTVRKAARPFVIGVAAASILAASACGGNDTTPTPVPTVTPKPASTATYTPEPTYTPPVTATAVPPTPTQDLEDSVTPESTPKPTPVLGNVYQEQLVQVGYSSDIAQRVASLSNTQNNINLANELVLIGEKAGYAKDKFVERILPFLENGITNGELVVVKDLDNDSIDNRTEIDSKSNVLDKFNKLPPSLESLAVLDNELYAVVAGNDDLVYAFDLQNFESLLKELKEAPYADKLMKKITSADARENVSEAWNYKVRREDDVLFNLLKLSPDNTEGWQFMFDNGSYHLKLLSDGNSKWT